MWTFKILVPTAFSPSSEAALDAAIELARKFEASIVLIHAYQIPVYPYPVALAGDLSLYVEEAAGKQLESVAAKLRGHGVSVRRRPSAGLGVGGNPPDREGARCRPHRPGESGSAWLASGASWEARPKGSSGTLPFPY